MAREMLTERRMKTLRAVLGRRQMDFHVVVENLIDAHNASAIVRTADGFGVGVVDYVFWKTAVPPVSVDVARGTKRWTVIQRFRSFEAFDADRRARGLRLVVTADGDVDGSVPFREFDWTGPTAVVFGHEREGSDPDVFRAADAVVTIPMLGFARSFNVSVAAAVLLAEVARQRLEAGLYEHRWDEWRERTLQMWVRRELTNEPWNREPPPAVPPPGGEKMFGLSGGDKTRVVAPTEALPGRDQVIPAPVAHFIHGARMAPPWPSGSREVTFGLGCFWGAEKAFWTTEGVYSTQVGYAAGHTPNPTYREVCTGKTGHNEVVRVIFDPARTSLEALLRVFWESHDPSQGMRQGNDVGTQYRSGIYVSDEATRKAAEASRHAFQAELSAAGFGAITTEITDGGPFFYAEEYHQQFLAKNPGGYCGLGGTGVACPVSPLGDG